jgi:hypothetical protein
MSCVLGFPEASAAVLRFKVRSFTLSTGKGCLGNEIGFISPEFQTGEVGPLLSFASIHPPDTCISLD